MDMLVFALTPEVEDIKTFFLFRFPTPIQVVSAMFGFIASLLGHMLTLSLIDSLLFNIFCALTVHKVYNAFEVDPADFLASFALLVGVPILPCYFLLAHLRSGVLAVLLSFILFYATLTLSIILYRISPLHPLSKYPGPVSLKISKFATMYFASSGKQYIYFKSLHDKYGPFVRVGPNELSVVDAEAIPPVLGLDGMRRGPLWTSHTKPGTTPHIIALRDVDLHHERRKLWNRAFTSASLKEYHPTVVSRVLQLVEELRKRVSGAAGDEKPVDLAQWLACFTYDFMGDMLFGGGFELMRDEDKDGIRPLLESYMKVLAILEHISWATRLFYRFSAVPGDARRYIKFVSERFDMRKQQGTTKRDLFYFFTNQDRIEEMDVPRDQALNETFAAIAAGADTSSTVLGGIFFYILSNHALFSKLQSEVDSVFPPGEGNPFDAAKLAGMPYLNAVINETLRLQPPGATQIQRSPLEGSGGKWVAGRFVPENTALYLPTYVLHRDERYFSPLPNEFIPERWLNTTGEGKFTMNTAAFVPFSSGPANCAGKNLALLEMRMVVATLVQRFDMRLADGYDPREWERELLDFFVMKVGELPVVLTARD